MRTSLHSVRRPEEEFLALCTRSPAAGAVPIPASLDWVRLLRVAETHRMTPLLQIRAGSRPGVPPDIRNTLAQRAVGVAARNQWLALRLLEILDVLGAAGIRALAIKGPVLALQAYGDLGARLFDDLDILLDKRDIPRAADLLMPQGFVPRLSLTEAERKAHVRAGWGYSLQAPDGAFYLELDSHIAADFFALPVRFDDLWLRRGEVRLNGSPVATLGPADLYLLLCAHGAKHLWHRYAWIADLRRLLDVCPPPWADTLRLADSQGARRMLLLGMELCRRVADAPLPESVTAAIGRDGAVGSLAERLEDDLRCGNVSAVESWKAKSALHLRMRERWRDRVAYVLREAFTPGYADWKTFRLPAGLFWLLYLLRPFRLAGGLFRRRIPPARPRSGNNSPRV